MMTKKCKICGYTFEIDNKDLALYKKFSFDPVALCFACDQSQRLCFRNERSLYTRKCDATGANIISIYSSDKPYKVYKSDYWYSDKWDTLSYGRDFDFSRPFFEQFHELQLEVPRIALSNVYAENSDYCNMTFGNKNCYLIFGGDFNENCMYGTLCMYNFKTFDCDYSNDNRLSYMICDSVNCYECRFAFDCNNCSNCYFVSDCIGCSECILCTNLVKKSYCINNKQLPKDEYLSIKKQLINGSYAQQNKNWQDFLDLRKKRIVKYAHIIQCQNSDGDYLKNCKSCHNTFDASNSEDLKNVIFSSKAKDCFNCSLLGDGSEVCYCMQSTLGALFSKFSYFTINSSNIEYSDLTIDSHNLFGCVGLRRKQYCILNKQYSKNDYEKLRERIVNHMRNTGEWGQFFPKHLSCFGYNETTAYDYFPMKKQNAIRQGFKWHDEEKHNYQPQTCEVADNINDIGTDIYNEILACTECKRNFKILDAEFKFYKKMHIPLPRKCSDCRHKQRIDLRNPRRLWDRKCTACGIEVKTTYSPKRPEKVYCEKCYLEEII